MFLCLSKGNCLHIIIVFIIAFNVSAKNIEIKCPEYCECDIFENLRRAVCQHKRLISIHLNIPTSAQILDISDNQISELGEKIFLEIGLTELKLLNLSHNKVRQIHFNGFEGLENLKTLDLSFNAIQYFTKSWFQSLSSLQELYLRGNKLKSINDEPLIDIQTLRVLDISKCGITHLNGYIFTMIPNVEVLDISENYIQRLKIELLKPLSKLTLFKAQDNNFNCKDRGLNIVKNYIRTAGISYKDPCIIDIQTSFTVNSRYQKFEKIIMAPDMEVTTSIQPKNLWIFDNEDVNNTKIIEVCSNNTAKGPNLDQKILLMHIIEMWPLTVISITFIYGVFSGMVITCCINLCNQRKRVKNINIVDGNISSNTTNIPSLSTVIPRRNRSMSGSKRSNSVLYTTLQKAKRQLSRDNDDDDDDNFDDGLMMNEFDLATSTPMQGRKTYA